MTEKWDTEKFKQLFFIYYNVCTPPYPCGSKCLTISTFKTFKTKLKTH